MQVLLILASRLIHKNPVKMQQTVWCQTWPSTFTVLPPPLHLSQRC